MGLEYKKYDWAVGGIAVVVIDKNGSVVENSPEKMYYMCGTCKKV